MRYLYGGGVLTFDGSGGRYGTVARIVSRSRETVGRLFRSGERPRVVAPPLTIGRIKAESADSSPCRLLARNPFEAQMTALNRVLVVMEIRTKAFRS